MGTGATYGERNLFTFRGEAWSHDVAPETQLPEPDDVANFQQYDLGILEITDGGDFANPAQLANITERIRDARTSNSHGAIVVAFIHGWHNNADWDNANLLSFRRLLRSLMTRELEALERRVIGVYLGWNGTPTDGVGRWVGRLPGLKHTTFRNRYRTANHVGTGDAMGETLVALTRACKDAGNGAPVSPAPLIMIGHSMGAYILQSAFRELMANAEAPLCVQPSDDGPVSLSTDSLGQVRTPDLLLSLNSAAEAEVAKDIIDLAAADNWTKRFDPREVHGPVAPYNPPLLISATSTADRATNWVWRAGHFLQKSSTDGHDATLATHTFARSLATAECAPAGHNDFGQPWHCLHKDVSPDPTPRLRIDLPDHDRSTGAALTHTAYDLIPHDTSHPKPFWLFQVPGDVIANHGDIFNFKAASLVLALIQASGVLASAVGTSWVQNFSEAALTD